MKITDIKAIEQSQTIVQSGVLELLRSEESKMLTALVNASDTGKLTDRDAAIGIAVIARIRRIFNGLNRIINAGVDAGHKLTAR